VKDGQFSTKSQVDNSYPITDFVTWVVVVCVVFSSFFFLFVCFVSAELKKEGVGRARFEHDTLEEKKAVRTVD
jgi:hypothetical protein